MKRTLATALAIAGAATAITLAAGCGSDSSASVPTGADMKGTWTGTASGYAKGKPHTWNGGATGRLVIDQADGQAFAGYKEYSPAEGGTVKEVLNGAISPDGEILITDEDGFYEGTVSDGTFTGRYAETGADNTAVVVTLTKK